MYEINPRWTAQSRRRAGKQGKNDRLDARAVAALVRQEASPLPRVHHEAETAILDLLVKEREAALAEVTACAAKSTICCCRSTSSMAATYPICRAKRDSVPWRFTHRKRSLTCRHSVWSPYAAWHSGYAWPWTRWAISRTD